MIRSLYPPPILTVVDSTQYHRFPEKFVADNFECFEILQEINSKELACVWALCHRVSLKSGSLPIGVLYP